MLKETVSMFVHAEQHRDHHVHVYRSLMLRRELHTDIKGMCSNPQDNCSPKASDVVIHCLTYEVCPSQFVFPKNYKKMQFKKGT